MDKIEEINVGDVVEISKGQRYPPKEEDSIGIVIEELPTTGDWPVFIVMWDGQIDGLPARRLKKLDKNKQACTNTHKN